MPGLSSEEILRAWETGAEQHPIDRALTLLAAGGAGDRAALARLPVGERDVGLLRLRAGTFGESLSVLVDCPVCSEPLGFAADSEELASGGPDRRLEDPYRLALEDGEVRLRRLDSVDLAAAARAPDVDTAGAVLVERSVAWFRRGGQDRPARELSSDDRDRIATRLGELDAQADVVFSLTCPGCAHEWQAPFDIGSFFFAEVEALARRLLREVAILAAAFGWGENQVLALTPARRRAYLELAGS